MIRCRRSGRQSTDCIRMFANLKFESCCVPSNAKCFAKAKKFTSLHQAGQSDKAKHVLPSVGAGSDTARILDESPSCNTFGIPHTKMGVSSTDQTSSTRCPRLTDEMSAVKADACSVIGLEQNLQASLTALNRKIRRSMSSMSCSI